jgi:hypothetical protein
MVVFAVKLAQRMGETRRERCGMGDEHRRADPIGQGGLVGENPLHRRRFEAFSTGTSMV